MVQKKSSFDEILFKRDGCGELIEQEFKLGNGESVWAVPLTIGEKNKLHLLSEDELIDYILLNKVKNPKYTNEDIKYIKPEYIKLFFDVIYDISGIKLKKAKKIEDEDDFGRHLRAVRGDTQESDSNFFLHNLGYTLLDVVRLTSAEINSLVKAHNRDVEKQNRNNKKYSKKKR